MKVIDIFKWEGFEIYESPELGGDQVLSPSINDFYKRFKPTGKTIENFELWAFSADGDKAFALVKDGVFYTILVAAPITNFPGVTKKESLIIRQTETPEEFRGNGYSPALIDGLVQLGYRIISDNQVSPNAIRVWEKLRSKRAKDITFWDTNKNTITDEDPKNKKHIRYVLESITYKCTSSILNDRTFWT